MIRTYIGLGSNLNHPITQVQQALATLKNLPHSRWVAHSPFYRSEPLGDLKQPDYINAVAALDTQLTADELLLALQAIEYQQGRRRSTQWASRTLDLDLLLYGQMRCETPHLTLPHPRLHERAFVLYPLQDLAADLLIPGHGLLSQLIRQCVPMRLERLAYDSVTGNYSS